MSDYRDIPAEERYRPENLERFVVTLLKRGPNYRSEPSPELEAQQREHLGHLWELHLSGKLVVMGPVLDDSDIRGFSIYRVDSVEEALALANEDPGVKSGRFVIEAHPWMTHRGILRSS
jgi:uncharacterized protein YciI